MISCYQNKKSLAHLADSHFSSRSPAVDDGVGKIVHLALEINSVVGFQQISLIEYGWRLASENFDSDEIKPGFADYAEDYAARCPNFFPASSGSRPNLTVLIFAKNGFFANHVEYTKSCGGRSIAITHAVYSGGPNRVHAGLLENSSFRFRFPRATKKRQ